MLQKPNIYGLNRAKMRKLKNLSCSEKRDAMEALLRDLAKLAIVKQDAILDANLPRWNAWIYHGRKDCIATAYEELKRFHGQAHKDYDDAHIEDICTPISRECAV